jgi:ubiquinone/menaquinone biosynthesis C-methylase UbiE
MTVIDAGCAMGFFSLPMARMTGESGRVICIDMQEKMLKKLMKRADKRGLGKIIMPHKAEPTSLKISDIISVADFALAFAVVHEVPDKDSFFSELFKALKPGGKLLVAEPRGHVSEQAFSSILRTAGDKGFQILEHPLIHNSISALMEKPVS